MTLSAGSGPATGAFSAKSPRVYDLRDPIGQKYPGITEDMICEVA
jgi:hypothetical protein